MACRITGLLTNLPQTPFLTPQLPPSLRHLTLTAWYGLPELYHLGELHGATDCDGDGSSEATRVTEDSDRSHGGGGGGGGGSGRKQAVDGSSGSDDDEEEDDGACVSGAGWAEWAEGVPLVQRRAAERFWAHAPRYSSSSRLHCNPLLSSADPFGTITMTTITMTTIAMTTIAMTTITMTTITMTTITSRSLCNVLPVAFE